MKNIELAPVWKRNNGFWFSPPIEADRLSDLFLFANEQPIKIMLKPNMEKHSPKSPDGYLVAIKG